MQGEGGRKTGRVQVRQEELSLKAGGGRDTDEQHIWCLGHLVYKEFGKLGHVSV